MDVTRNPSAFNILTVVSNTDVMIVMGLTYVTWQTACRLRY